jgi:hypothetical protein
MRVYWPVTQQWIYAHHIKNTSCDLVLLLHSHLYRTTTEAIRLLPAYSLPRECVYRVVAYKGVYMSHYKGIYIGFIFNFK